MRKITAILVMISLCVFTFFGCSSKNNEETEASSQSASAATGITNSDEQADTAEITSASENQGDAQGTKAPDASRPAVDKGNMVIGKIVAVAGNQITIDVAKLDDDFKMPEMNGEDFTMPEGMTGPEGMEPPEDFEFNGEMPDFSGGFPGGDFPSDGKLPEGMSMPDFANGNFPSGGQMPQFDFGDIELEYTGEKQKYIISKGIKVGSGDYTSLSKGMVVGLQLDESGTVNSVMIISQK